MGIIIDRKNPGRDFDEKVKRPRGKKMSNRSLTILTLLAALISTYLLMEMQTYTKMKIVENYGHSVTSNGSYKEFAKGVLKYSRDGISYLSKTGEERWNQSYQIKNPVVVVSEEAVAVAEQEGTDIYVFDMEGMKGEIHATAPIEKLTVSNNGIVAALLRNEEAAQIVCYDATGNILVSHKATLTGMGYPIGMALSPSGTKLIVSYLAIEEGTVATRVSFYDFSGAVSSEDNYRLSEEIYTDVLIPTVYFAAEEKAVLVGDSGYWYCEIKNGKISSKTIEIEKEITSVFWEGETLGFVLKNPGQEGQEVRLYNLNGSSKMSKKISGEYANVKLSQGNVLLFDGKKACIISSWGVREFDGETEKSLMEIISLSGINKYLVMSADGIEAVRLTK